MKFDDDSLNMELRDLVPPTSEIIQQILKVGYATYAEINKKLVSDKEKEKNEFEVKHETNIFTLLSRNIDSQVYFGSPMYHIRNTELAWSKLSLKCWFNTLRINYLGKELIFKLNDFCYPDYMELFYMLQDNNIFPSKGRIVSLMIFSSTEGMRNGTLVANNYDWDNILSNVDKNDIQYLDFLKLIEIFTDITIKVKSACILIKTESLNNENWQKLAKAQMHLDLNYKNIEIE